MPEQPPVLLAVGGLDPSGGAGLAMDARAAAGAGVFLRPVASALTVQDSRGVKHVGPVDERTLRASVEAALAEGADVVKTGLLPDAPTVRLLERTLPAHVPLVVDPVLRATSGDDLVEEDVPPALLRLVARATLATPNVAEARRLTGLDAPSDAAWALRKAGARNVLITGGDTPGARVQDVLLTQAGDEIRLEAPRIPGGPWRGTGCALALLSAAHLAQGYDVATAVEAAVDETRDAITRAFPQPGASLLPSPRSLLMDARAHDEDTRQRAARVARAWRALAPQLDRRDVPEVGSNLSFLPADGDVDRSAGLSARCVRTGRGILLAGPVEIGGIHHTARIAAAAHAHDPRVRAALNVRYSPERVNAAHAEGLSVASFRREDQPPSEPSTVFWGTRAAVDSAGRVPDVIFDLGGSGKEPMIRILGHDPEQVVANLALLFDGQRGSVNRARKDRPRRDA